ncbi:MAG: hypothetical protein ACI4Q4_10115, partial [Oscillospiraceae bacterium]
MAKYSFEQLEKKYNGFVGADCVIDVDGFELNQKFRLRNVTVQISAMYEAGYCEFTVFDGFDNTGSGFEPDKELAKKLTIGKNVTIKLGYGGKLSDVFKGYVDALKIDYNVISGFS